MATASAADAGVAKLFVSQVEGVRQLDRRFGAAQLLPGLQGQIDHMQSLLHFSASPGARTALAAALTEAATLAGWQALDLGNYRQSWRLHEIAKTAAREARAPALLAHATAQQAYVLLDLGRAREAVEQVEHARSEAGGWLPPLMDTWLYRPRRMRPPAKTPPAGRPFTTRGSPQARLPTVGIPGDLVWRRRHPDDQTVTDRRMGATGLLAPGRGAHRAGSAGTGLPSGRPEVTDRRRGSGGAHHGQHGRTHTTTDAPNPHIQESWSPDRTTTGPCVHALSGVRVADLIEYAAHRKDL